MDCTWIKVSPSIKKGIAVINHLDDTKFEQFLRHIVTKMKLQDTEIFTDDERQKLGKIFKIEENNLQLAMKTVLYLFRRLLKFIFMPIDLKNDLSKIGLSNEKSEFIVKVWSTETRTTLNELGSEVVDKNGDSLSFTWKLSAELSSDYHKKSKVPIAYISLSQKDETEIEMTHPELYSLFLQFESIQNELDNTM